MEAVVNLQILVVILKLVFLELPLSSTHILCSPCLWVLCDWEFPNSYHFALSLPGDSSLLSRYSSRILNS